MATISLEGLDKAAVLAALYNASQPQGLGFMQYDPNPMSVEEAQVLLARGNVFEYLKGRVMKINLTGDELDTWGYDRDNGQGAAEMAIESLRSTNDPNNILIKTQHTEAAKTQLGVAESHLDEPTVVKDNGRAVDFKLGMGDMKPYMEPALKRARESINSPLE